jgi:hypothetical protein
MTETDISLLEPTCTLVDVKWMALRGWVQVVHDLESGYGDPLRSKVNPNPTPTSLEVCSSGWVRELRKVQCDL